MRLTVLRTLALLTLLVAAATAACGGEGSGGEAVGNLYPLNDQQRALVREGTREGAKLRDYYGVALRSEANAGWQAIGAVADIGDPRGEIPVVFFVDDGGNVFDLLLNSMFGTSRGRYEEINLFASGNADLLSDPGLDELSDYLEARADR